MTRELAARFLDMNTRLQISMLDWPPSLPILTPSQSYALARARLGRLSALLDRLDLGDACKSGQKVDDGALDKFGGAWQSDARFGGQPIYIVSCESNRDGDKVCSYDGIVDYLRNSQRSPLVSVVETSQDRDPKKRRLSTADGDRHEGSSRRSNSSQSHRPRGRAGGSKRKAGWMIFLEAPASAEAFMANLEKYKPISGAYLMMNLHDRKAAAFWLVPLLEEMALLSRGAQRLEIQGWIDELFQDLFVVVSEEYNGREQIQASMRLPSCTRINELRECLIENGVAGAEWCPIETKEGKQLQERMCLARGLIRVYGASKRLGNGNTLELKLQRRTPKTIESGDIVFLRGSYGRYIDVEDGEVQARWLDTGAWQELVIKKSGDGLIHNGDMICLKTHLGSYMCADGHVVAATFGRRTRKHQFMIMKARTTENMIGKKSPENVIKSDDEIHLMTLEETYMQCTGAAVVQLVKRKPVFHHLVITKPKWEGMEPDHWQIDYGEEYGWQVKERGPHANAEIWPLHVLPPANADRKPDLTIIFFSALNSAHAFDDCPTWLDLGVGIQVRLVCPLHPRRRLTSGWGYYSSADGKAHAWHDISEQLCVWLDLVDAPSLRAARRELHKLIAEETALLEGRSHRIVLAGHSHGACFALDGLLSSEKELGGAVCAVAHVLTAPHVPPSADPLSGAAPGGGSLPNLKTPIFMLNGQKDDVYPAPMVRQDVRRLKATGYKAVNHHQVSTAGHEIGKVVYKKWWLAALKKIVKRCKAVEKKRAKEAAAARRAAEPAPSTPLGEQSSGRRARSRSRSPGERSSISSTGSPCTSAPPSELALSDVETAPGTPTPERAQSPERAQPPRKAGGIIDPSGKFAEGFLSATPTSSSVGASARDIWGLPVRTSVGASDREAEPETLPNPQADV
mmetsp:Transcript_45301/g.80434  ORF Transcript_45301/g.80434 Transcript_45301/m.80434 type:complete len:911 (+) Transcript_45301:81-2813(+)